ncbi:helix-turn-helix transcriptional regulator [Sarcina sp. JB2]|uniref:Helix-turn-helix transcriptional regulator n=1 Tax=Candidatus Sarcina troglodytae TaxID=2726954 RepID=A0ACD1BF10_9CLOT|nr:helix-turn-helix transcriptional regulator [Sarcina sp. JB2]QPJ86064.1 helix-turn-helix transcriptional regulator [Sarcina sp. JB2]
MNMSLNYKLKECRNKLNLSQEYVANILNMEKTKIIAIENGAKEVTKEEINSFSNLYGIRLEELLHMEQECINQKMFARTFSKLSDCDKKEILDLLELKKRLKCKEV